MSQVLDLSNEAKAREDLGRSEFGSRTSSIWVCNA